MAIIKTGILFTGIEGSIGNVTITRDKAGRNIGRQKITTMSNPKTVLQVEQRAKFALANEIASKFPLSISRGWRNEANRNPLHTPRNRFMSKNLTNGFMQNGAAAPNFLELNLGEGELAPPVIDNAAVVNDGGILKIEGTIINNSAGTNGQDDDRMLIGAVRLSDGRVVLTGSKKREDGAFSLAVTVQPDTVVGEWVMIVGVITVSEYVARGGGVMQALIATDATYIQSDIVCFGKFNIV